MPSESAKQERAMEAAAHGHSTLGIPQSVGQEFIDADAASGKFRHNAMEPHPDAKTPKKGGRVKRRGY